MGALQSGYFYGALGVLGFSLTLATIRAAVMDLNPLIVGLAGIGGGSLGLDCGHGY